MLEPPRFACVVAADEARVMGKDNDLPWPRLAGDTEHFKRITTATRDPARRNAVIMGRRTWDSLPRKYRPLDRRFNIVVSASIDAVDDPGTPVARTLDRAVAAAVDAGVESIFVVGGAQLYTLAVADPRCELLYYTHIAAKFAGDTVFPAFADRYTLEAEDPPRTDNGVTYWFQRWRRGHTIGA